MNKRRLKIIGILIFILLLEVVFVFWVASEYSSPNYNLDHEQNEQNVKDVCHDYASMFSDDIIDSGFNYDYCMEQNGY